MIAKIRHRRASASKREHYSNFPKGHAIPGRTTTTRNIAAYLLMPARQCIFAVGIAWGGIALFGMLRIQQAQAQDAETKYLHMAPVEQYLMNRDAEIAWPAARPRIRYRGMRLS
jgi:hypothetical protein